MAPTTQKSLYLPQKCGDYTVGEMPVPTPSAGQVLLKIVATSLNPVDWKIKKHGLFLEQFPAVLGTDIAGTVEELGEGVTEWKKGDKVFIQGQFVNEFASFQQYALAIASTLARVRQLLCSSPCFNVPLLPADTHLICTTAINRSRITSPSNKPPLSPSPSRPPTLGSTRGTPMGSVSSRPPSAKRWASTPTRPSLFSAARALSGRMVRASSSL